MSATKIISNTDKFMNLFTCYGRNKNKVINRLEKRGFSEFRERTLKDNSQVLLAYRTPKNLATYAYRFFPDLSMVKKESGIKRAFWQYLIELNQVRKTVIDKKGKMIKEYLQRLRFIDDVCVEKEKRIYYPEQDLKIEKTEIPNTWKEYDKTLVKSYEKSWGDNFYKYFQEADGTNYYIKDIEGVAYRFSSK